MINGIKVYAETESELFEPELCCDKCGEPIDENTYPYGEFPCPLCGNPNKEG